ncbi:hypothetical protein [Actomonas aquatica]|uniref:Uncharacterized protein n=1 Tax=Actomonas aquatica TaxID=2866162 RepID=A0ABZ1CEY1_9BACT|nr:hypothetical protein [Opitutus sp. WL0086]WRQ89857.1 hypothetical protein K1X11_010610 [Opitutus sp. WL0086]
MNITNSLIVSSLIAPATMVVGLSAPIALGITAVAGVLSIALMDYGTSRMSYLDESKVTVAANAKSEKHALAA